MHLSSKRFEAAAALVANILAKHGRNTAGLKLRASLHMENGKHTEAIADLRQALADQPRSVALMSALAIAYERSGSIELADKQFTDATRAANFEPRVGLDYVAFLRRRGSLARAEDTLIQLASRAGRGARNCRYDAPCRRYPRHCQPGAGRGPERAKQAR